MKNLAATVAIIAAITLPVGALAWPTSSNCEIACTTEHMHAGCQLDYLECEYKKLKEDPMICDYIHENMLFADNREFERCN